MTVRDRFGDAVWVLRVHDDAADLTMWRPGGRFNSRRAAHQAADRVLELEPDVHAVQVVSFDLIKR